MMNRSIALTLAAALLAACDSDKNDSASATQDGSTSGATDPGDGESASSTGGPTGPTTSAGSASDSEGGGASSTSGGTSASTSATSGGDEPGVCQSYCGRFVECGIEAPEDLGECLEACGVQLAGLAGECLGATTASLGCVAALGCEELEAGELGSCEDEAATQQEACGLPGECGFGGGGDIEGAACEYMIDCVGEPTLEMRCDVETCECLVDQKPVGSCPAEGVCVDIGGLEAKAEACCGFVAPR